MPGRPVLAVKHPCADRIELQNTLTQSSDRCTSPIALKREEGQKTNHCAFTPPQDSPYRNIETFCSSDPGARRDRHPHRRFLLPYPGLSNTRERPEPMFCLPHVANMQSTGSPHWFPLAPSLCSVACTSRGQSGDRGSKADSGAARSVRCRSNLALYSMAGSDDHSNWRKI